MSPALKKLLLFLATSITLFGGYRLAQIISPSGLLTTTALDHSIPYLNFFVIFYLLYVPILLVPIILFWNDDRRYKVLMCSFLITIVVSELIYVFLQTEVTRQQALGSGFFDAIVASIYAADPPVNALPSLHVSLSTLAALFTSTKSRKIGILIFPVVVLIILSTLFIKQHAMLDAIAGLLLAAVVFRVRKVWLKPEALNTSAPSAR